MKNNIIQLVQQKRIIKWIYRLWNKQIGKIVIEIFYMYMLSFTLQFYLYVATIFCYSFLSLSDDIEL